TGSIMIMLNEGHGGHHKRLVIVSNRLPFTAIEENRGLRFTESPGGLVSGLSAYLDSLRSKGNHIREYIWVGWPGSTISDARKEELKTKALEQFNSYPVFLSQEEMDAFYLGFCNKTIWPLFHYFPSYANYEEALWQHYIHVNKIFRDTVAEVVRPDDIVWVHDYHLMLLPKLLRAGLPAKGRWFGPQAGLPSTPVGFFLHIPFPSFEVFRLLPVRWRRDILEGLLGADLNGFHTYEYMQHFLQSVLRILGHEHHMGQIATPERIVKVGAFPMGVDFSRYTAGPDDPVVKGEREELRNSLSQFKV